MRTGEKMDFLEISIVFKVDGVLRLGNDLSSAIRGLWGRSLKKIYCFQRQLDCRDCSLENCTYYVLFEKQLSHSEQYHPYIIRAESTAENRIAASFVFFGWICEHFDKLIFSLIALDGNTLVRDGQSHKLSLHTICDSDGNLLFSEGSKRISIPKIRKLRYHPQAADTILLTLKTPLRQKHQGKLMDSFVWESFAKSLIKRIRFIDAHYNHGRLQIPDQIEIEGVEVLTNETRWSEKIRMSFRQDSKMSIGGLVGTVCLRGVSPEMLGIIILARFLHAGKQCSFGNGKIGLKNLSDPAHLVHTPRQN